jgi:gamma-glutamyltranspeptidase/glutathione hydrolase
MPPGILRTVMPAAPAAWIKALEQYGTMSFGEVAQAAIRLTRDGFAMHGFMADYIREHEENYRRWPSSVAVFLPQGRPPNAGELFVQKELSATLQYMVNQEAAHRSQQRTAAGHGRLPYPVFFPDPGLSTDNAAMIAAAAFPKFACGEFAGATAG